MDSDITDLSQLNYHKNMPKLEQSNGDGSECIKQLLQLKALVNAVSLSDCVACCFIIFGGKYVKKILHVMKVMQHFNTGLSHVTATI